MEVEWRTDRPPKDGYYLITWADFSNRSGGKLWVSEAYYSSRAIVRWWWSRRYTGAPSQGIEMAVRHEVIAWMEMPKPYVEET